MAIEGEAVVPERVEVVVVEVRAVEAGPLLGVRVPGEVLADFPDRPVEVVLLRWRLAARKACTRAAAVMSAEVPPCDVLAAVVREAGAAGIGRGEVAAVDAKVLGLSSQTAL